MTKLSILALTAALAIGGIAAPAFAAPTASGNVPLCDAGSGSSLAHQQDALSTQLQLSTKAGSSIEVWNGCFKVMTTDANGKTDVAFYDPDTLDLVGHLS